MKRVLFPCRLVMTACVLVMLPAACRKREEAKATAPAPPTSPAATVAAGDRDPAQASAPSPSVAASDLSMDNVAAADFSSHKNTEFALRLSEDSTVTATLVEVKETPQALDPALKAKGLRTPFTLLFECQTPEGVLPLAEGIYDVNHPKLGAHSIYLLPVRSRDGSVRHLEAIFN